MCIYIYIYTLYIYIYICTSSPVHGALLAELVVGLAELGCNII